MLTLAKGKDFDDVYRILEDSLPPEERRGYQNQRALLDRSDYKIYLSRAEDGDARGFLATYDFEDFLFIEHFAVNKKYRNQGLGAAMVRALRAQTDKLLCLEAEPPESELSRRRIAFYERNGFFLHEYPYIQPPIEEGKPPVPLRLMTTDAALSFEALDAIKTVLYQRVYGQK